MLKPRIVSTNPAKWYACHFMMLDSKFDSGDRHYLPIIVYSLFSKVNSYAAKRARGLASKGRQMFNRAVQTFSHFNQLPATFSGMHFRSVNFPLILFGDSVGRKF